MSEQGQFQACVKRVCDRIDADAVCQLALELTRIASPTGEEGPLGEFVLDWFRCHGLGAIRQEVEAGRVNAVGIVRGRGDGPSLMLNGHLDVGTAVRHEDLVGPVPPPAPLIEPYRQDDLLYGTGMDNMKSGLAAIMSAARAIHESKLQLRGDLIVATVVGEIGRAPVDQYQGPHYRSKGIGTHYLLTHGIVSDYAIVADTSHFGLAWAQCGVVYAKITLPGRSLYTPFTRRAAQPRDSDNAIVRMMLLVEALEHWASEYERNSIYRYGGGEVHPKVNLGAIAGGAPYKASSSPKACSLYVDIRTPPRKRPAEVQRELRAVCDGLGLEYELELFTSQMGYEGTGVDPLVAAIHEAHELVSGHPLPPIDPVENSMWTDTNLYNEVGIPAVKYGIGAALRPAAHGEFNGMERVLNSTRMADLVQATKTYAAASVRVCGWAD